MRLAAILTALPIALASACTTPATTTSRVDQSGNLKVNPALLGQPAPAEPKTEDKTPPVAAGDKAK